ncbi:MAG: hypothetical protein KatS3mg082_2900 [Nitrospiraceae bacterium]|nr:MAG: hypothetical protein KatS3mg082_2900 [Nitrospiraceae bacterium]
MGGESASSLEEMFWRIVNAESALQRERLLTKIHQEQPTSAMELERLLKAHAEVQGSSFCEIPSVYFKGPDDPTLGIQGHTVEFLIAEGELWFVCRFVQPVPRVREEG